MIWDALFINFICLMCVSTLSHRVSSEKGKSLFFSTKFRFDLFREKCEIFANKRVRKFWGKGKNFAKKYGREIINYDTIKLIMLSSQSREFLMQFCAIFCFSRNYISLNFAFFRLINFLKKYEISRKRFGRKPYSVSQN